MDGEDWGRDLIKAECVFLFKQIRVIFWWGVEFSGESDEL